ncbi:MAG: glutamate--tRNA ligase [Nanoarchaeota archaeon]
MKDLILKYALKNAFDYNGKANFQAVLGKILNEKPELRQNIKEIAKEINDVIKKVNLMSLEQQKKEISKYKFHEVKKEIKLKKIKGKVITRIAPEPSKYLHIGHALVFIINSEYAKKYNGSCILRLEDTNPEKATKEYIKSILEDLKWLKIKYNKTVICSKRMSLYYKYAKELINKEKAYVCFCSRDKIKELRAKKIRCECFDHSVSENLKYWNDMLNKKYSPGQANLRLVGIMDSDNGTLRDPTIFRISKAKHYLYGNKYSVWPLYDFENSIEDSILGVTHVVRSKEFELRAELQELIKDYLNLKKQEVIEIGRFNILGAVTQGREIRKLIEEKKVFGWDDPRLVTVRALRRRGFTPESFHRLSKEVGMSKSETNIDIRVLASINRKLIDKETRRYFVIFNPKKIKINNAPKLKIKAPLHPDFNYGFRNFNTKNEFYIQDDLENNKNYRFMHLFNFRNNKFISKELDRSLDAKLIHWLPVEKDLVNVEVVMDNGQIIKGLGESNLRKVKVNEVIQAERNFFMRLDKKEKNKLIFWFTHK